MNIERYLKEELLFRLRTKTANIREKDATGQAVDVVMDLRGQLPDLTSGKDVLVEIDGDEPDLVENLAPNKGQIAQVELDDQLGTLNPAHIVFALTGYGLAERQDIDTVREEGAGASSLTKVRSVGPSFPNYVGSPDQWDSSVTVLIATADIDPNSTDPGNLDTLPEVSRRVRAQLARYVNSLAEYPQAGHQLFLLSLLATQEGMTIRINHLYSELI